jgi:hypothetical protein
MEVGVGLINPLNPEVLLAIQHQQTAFSLQAAALPTKVKRLRKEGKLKFQWA